MKKLIALFMVLGGAAACTPGGAAGGQGNFGGGADTENATCVTQLVLTGQQLQAPGGFVDPEDGSGLGCKMAGTWTVSVQEVGASVETPGVPACQPGQVQLQQSYTYQVSVDGENLATIVPDDDMNRTKITGEGECAGTFEHTGFDGMSMVLLKPFANSAGIITGTGEAMVLNRPAD